jgi:diguanylate cyclase (GGDEF)-like protein
LEYRLVRPDGSIRWIRDRRFPVCDQQGHYIRLASIVTDISEHRQARDDLLELNKKLQQQATHDMLTGLPNRRLFSDRLERALAHARRFGGRVGMLFIDLDGFKDINDRFGHQAGDEALVLMAKRIKLLLREVDSAARLGGDEFGIVLPDVLLVDDVKLVGDKVLQAIRQPFIMRKVSCTLGASIGIAAYPDHGETVDELITNADKAMYQVKKNSKAGVGIYRLINSDKGTPG